MYHILQSTSKLHSWTHGDLDVYLCCFRLEDLTKTMTRWYPQGHLHRTPLNHRACSQPWDPLSVSTVSGGHPGRAVSFIPWAVSHVLSIAGRLPQINSSLALCVVECRKRTLRWTISLRAVRHFCCGYDLSDTPFFPSSGDPTPRHQFHDTHEFYSFWCLCTVQKHFSTIAKLYVVCSKIYNITLAVLYTLFLSLYSVQL